MKKIFLVVFAVTILACACSQSEIVTWQENPKPIPISIVQMAPKFVELQKVERLNRPNLPEQAIGLAWKVDLSHIDWKLCQSVDLRVFLPEEKNHPVVIHLDSKTKTAKMIAFFPDRYYNYQVVAKLVKSVKYRAIQEGRVTPSQYL